MPDPELLFQQAPMTAHDYMSHGVHDIDGMFGEGFAEAHPALLAAYMQTASIDYGASLIASKIGELRESLRSDHPLQGETFDGFASAIESIADKIDRAATHLKYLGTGDAATTMGAIEFLGASVKEAAEQLAARDITEQAP
jgi:hypothetical protein